MDRRTEPVEDRAERRSSDALRDDAEATGRRLATTWKEVRSRLRPTALLREAAAFVRRKTAEVGEKVERFAVPRRHGSVHAAVALSRGKRGARETFRRHPVGVGLAVLGAGAAVALLVPSTRREREVLGEAADRAKRRVARAGKRLLRAATDVARPARETS